MTTKKPPILTGVYDPALDEPELTPEETAAALGRAAAAKRALRHYLELVQQIPEVVEVRRSADDLLCTVISADPLDRRARFQVFEAQTRFGAGCRRSALRLPAAELSVVDYAGPRRPHRQLRLFGVAAAVR